MDRPFYSALSHLNLMYGIDMKDDQFENIAMHAWDHIGNKHYRLYEFKGKVVNRKLDLPCNADAIEAVLGAGQSVVRATGEYNSNSYFNASRTEDWIEQLSKKGEALYVPGHYEDYTVEGNTLSFKEDGMSITILYKGYLADEDGLPFLNFKEIDAIAKYCAFVDTQKKAMVTRDKATWDMATFLRQQWQIACDDARTPILLNQNDMDNILNVQSSWDRKRFGLSYKTIR